MGTLQDVVEAYKQKGEMMDESLVVWYSVELLKVSLHGRRPHYRSPRIAFCTACRIVRSIMHASHAASHLH